MWHLSRSTPTFNRPPLPPYTLMRVFMLDRESEIAIPEYGTLAHLSQPEILIRFPAHRTNPFITTIRMVFDVIVCCCKSIIDRQHRTVHRWTHCRALAKRCYANGSRWEERVFEANTLRVSLWPVRDGLMTNGIDLLVNKLGMREPLNTFIDLQLKQWIVLCRWIIAVTKMKHPNTRLNNYYLRPQNVNEVSAWGLGIPHQMYPANCKWKL